MKKIKWGVIGTAGIARSCTIPGMIQAYNCELYAIAGRSIDKAEQFKEKFGFELLQSYRLEVEQFGRCIDENEIPAVTEEFSLKNVRLVERILEEIGY